MRSAHLRNWLRFPVSLSSSAPAAGFVSLESLTTGSLKGDNVLVGVNELRTENRELRTGVFVSDIFAHTELLAAPVFEAANERTRPNLKVQDGCDNRCSFCVIPYVRGQSRSLNLDQIVQEVNDLVAAGYRELVISGINLGRWGRDLEAGVGSQVSGVGRWVSGVSSQVSAAHRDEHALSNLGFSQRPSTDDQRLVHL